MTRNFKVKIALRLELLFNQKQGLVILKFLSMWMLSDLLPLKAKSC